jgi:P27 family predicted phage terminase small subunit
MRGRKPSPAHLKLIAGTRRKGRGAGTVIPPALPEPPDFLHTYAKVEWGRVAPLLYRQGLLTKLDGAVLAAYCDSYARWQEAEGLLADMRREDPIYRGLLIVAGNGTRIQNPVVGICNRAAQDVVKYSAELGMTPSSRSRIDPAKTMLPIWADDPADRFFT